MPERETPASKNSALAFDFGERRIGVAFANKLSDSAVALKTLNTRDRQTVDAEITALIKEWSPDALVIGVPYNTDGTESRMTALAREFGAQLGAHYGLPVEPIDERLTSMEARMILQEQRRTGQRNRRVRREEIDSLAARLIAESWLRAD